MGIRKGLVNKKNSGFSATVKTKTRSAKSTAPSGHQKMKNVITMQEVRNIAKSKGINSSKMKKADLIKSIQRSEGNFDCFGTAITGFCDQNACLWIAECITDRNHRVF